MTSFNRLTEISIRKKKSATGTSYGLKKKANHALVGGRACRHRKRAKF